ncbi:hypothetical protein PG985_013701 [Apiospora marii]|uniref:uncharacterized protein n=1 Tax=Apiospora marii TaxID=335849 RepID=UPI00312F0947
MDNNNIPFFVQRGGNSAQAVGGPSRGRTMAAEHLRDPHLSSPSQEETHPTLRSLVEDSEPLTAVEPTADGARQFATTPGPNNSTVLAPPAARRWRAQASGNQIARALQQVPLSYGGNITSADNLSASIPASQNCSLFIRNLPPTLAYEQVFAAMRGIGRIVSVYINRPTGFHPNCAAKPPGPDGGSRVVRVTGSPNVVNEEFLLSYFAAHFFFELDGAPKVVHRGYASASVEFAFAAFVNQAENAYELLTQNRRQGQGFGRGSGRGFRGGRGRGRGRGGMFAQSGSSLSVAYVRDPCEEGLESLS